MARNGGKASPGDASMVRGLATVGGATMVSRVLGFIRDAAIAALFGAGMVSDAVLAILQVVNLARRLLAEGALNAAFVPLWLRLEHAGGAPAAKLFFQRALGAMLLVSSMVALVGVAFAPAAITVLLPGFTADEQALAAGYLRLAAPYVILAGMAALAAALLHAHTRVLAAAAGVVAFNLVLLTALAAISALSVPAQTGGAIVAAAVVAAGTIQLIITWSGLLWRGHAPGLPRFKLSPEVRQFFVLAIPSLVAAGIPQLKLIGGMVIASSSPAAISWLYYANRLYELPLGVISISVAAVLGPAIALAARAREPSAMSLAQARGLEFALGLALPAALALALLAEPIAATLFERGAFDAHDSAAVAAAVLAISAGLPGHALEKLLGAISFAHEDSRTPMLAALLGLGTALAASIAWFPRYGYVGVAGAIAVSAWVGATMMTAVLWQRRWLHLPALATRRLARILVAAAIMAVAILLMRHLLTSWPRLHASHLGRLTLLLLVVPAGLTIYLAALEALGVAHLRDLWRGMRARL
ncbi:MAG: murein biosynthesis integral membrane protein MurJ [Xanthobacteraceae bacterium]